VSTPKTQLPTPNSQLWDWELGVGRWELIRSTVQIATSPALKTATNIKQRFELHPRV